MLGVGGKDLSLPTEYYIHGEGGVTSQLLTETRVLLPAILATPSVITLDKLWLITEGTRAGLFSSLLHCSVKEMGKEPEFRSSDARELRCTDRSKEIHQLTTKTQRFWTSHICSMRLLENALTFIIKSNSTPYLSQNIQLSYNMLQGICNMDILLLPFMVPTSILRFCFLKMNTTIHFR